MAICIHCKEEEVKKTDTCPECNQPYSEKKECAHCGFAALGSFSGDQCPECFLTYWKCGGCGRIEASEKPPAVCPACKEPCDFKNITCYTPECGGPGNIDPRL